MKRYRVNVNLINAETHKTTGRERDPINDHSNIEYLINLNGGQCNDNKRLEFGIPIVLSLDAQYIMATLPIIGDLSNFWKYLFLFYQRT